MDTPTGWELKDGKLVREYAFTDFEAAMQFLNQVAALAEAQQHHPEIWNSYNKVTLTLSTHDAGDVVTEKDIALAAAINTL